MRRAAVAALILLMVLVLVPASSADLIRRDPDDQPHKLDISRVSSQVYGDRFQGMRTKIVRITISLYHPVRWRKLQPNIDVVMDTRGRFPPFDYNLTLFWQDLDDDGRIEPHCQLWRRAGLVLDDREVVDYAFTRRRATCAFPKAAMYVREGRSVRWAVTGSYFPPGDGHLRVDEAPDDWGRPYRHL